MNPSAVQTPREEASANSRVSGFNTRLRVMLAIVVGIILLRLGQAATTHDNWRGFVISTLHVVVVAVGSYFVLRRRV
jgi:hypothetical protein